MQFVKKYFVKRELRKKNDQQPDTLLPKVKWTIIYDLATQACLNSLIKELQNTYSLRPNDVKTICIADDSDSRSTLSYDSLNWLGKLKENEFDKELMSPCGYLIIYTLEADLLTKYLERFIHKDLQIGLANDGIDNTLTIDVNAEETATFVRELEKYIPHIKHKNEAI